MSLPVTSIRLSNKNAFSSISDNNQRYGIIQFNEFADKLVINGLLYSHDLRTCYGSVPDTSGRNIGVRARWASLSQVASNAAGIYRFGTSATTWAESAGNTFALSSTERITSGINLPNVGGIAACAISTTGARSLNTWQIANNGASGIDCISYGTEHWIVHTGQSSYPEVLRLDSGFRNSTLMRNTGFTVSNSLNTYIMTAAFPLSDGAIALGTCTTTTSSKWGAMAYNGVTSATSYATTNTWLPKLTSGTNVRVATQFAQFGVGQFYALEMAPLTSDRHIRFVTIPNAASVGTGTGITTPVCTADFTPFADQNIASAATEIDYVTRIKLVTLNGIKYLFVGLFSILRVPEATYDNPSKLIVYEINSSDPTILTLRASTTLTRASTMLITNTGKVYCGRANSIDVWSFDTSSSTLSQTDTISADVTYLIGTEAGRVYSIDLISNWVHDITSSIPNDVRVTVGVPSVKSTGSNQTIPVYVEAYNGSNVRVATNVTLSVTGGTFTDGTTSTNVTTLVSAPIATQVIVNNVGTVTVSGVFA